MEFMTKDDGIYDGNNHIKVIWEDTLDNHSSIKEKEIEKYFQNKYKTHRVKVIFKPITSKDSTVVAEGGADASELVLDETYQKALITQYIKDNNINVSLEHLMKLDSSVNIELENYKEQTNRYKTFKINRIQFSNFLSFGDNNELTFKEKQGITSVVSSPANYGGKTSATVDLLLFLFFGSTSKTEKLEEIFNLYTDKNTVEVKGEVEIENEIYIIKRNITRKTQKDGSYSCKSEVDFYQMLPKGGIKRLNGEQRRFTDELIKTYVGSIDDFLITILTTGDNLDDLIKTKPTERGRILTRFIGLEFFREKEKIAKKKHVEWKEKSKLYKNNSQEIKDKITKEEDIIKLNDITIGNQKIILDGFKSEIGVKKIERDNLLKSRYNDIDTDLYKTDESTILDGVEKLKILIDSKNVSIKALINGAPEPKTAYNIDNYGLLKSQLKEYVESELTYRLDITSLVTLIKSLKEDEVCQLCKRTLDDIDNSELILKNEGLLVKKQKVWEKAKVDILSTTKKIETEDIIKQEWDDYNRNILLIDNAKLELKAYTDSYNRGNEKLAQYTNIKTKIAENKLIDTNIQVIDIKITELTESKDMQALSINSIEQDNRLSKANITEYESLIGELKREEIVDNIFKVYLDVYGKNGISKMVLSTMMPLINSYLKILLSDTCEFILEMRMNEKGEIEFWMIDQSSDLEKLVTAGSGYEKTVSSLALRCVLSKVCSLPKPNIIFFDEITGKVSNDNLDKIGLFFDKLKQFFDHIWLISHNPLIQDWADYVVNIKKENNISKITTSSNTEE